MRPTLPTFNRNPIFDLLAIISLLLSRAPKAIFLGQIGTDSFLLKRNSIFRIARFFLFRYLVGDRLVQGRESLPPKRKDAESSSRLVWLFDQSHKTRKC